MDQEFTKRERNTRLLTPSPLHPSVLTFAPVCPITLSQVDPSLFFVINSVYRTSSNLLSCTCRHCEFSRRQFIDNVRAIFPSSISSDWNRKLFRSASTILYRDKKVISEINQRITEKNS